MRVQLAIFSALIVATVAKKGFGPTEQEWGFVEVRPSAHLFWWLHQTNADVQKATERPLVIWLQGGPGGSSTGFGNFGELGPLDDLLNDRNTTWLNDANVLFVDNPVGTGFSWVGTGGAFATTNRQIADDFLAMLTAFYGQLPEWKTAPLYIFCESYGGKMTAEIALVIDEAVKAGKLDIQLKAVGLGDSWISPIDSVLTWGEYLFQTGMVDTSGRDAINAAAQAVQAAIDLDQWSIATNLWSIAEGVVFEAGDGAIDFYNILTKISSGWKNTRLNATGMMKSTNRDINDVDANIELIMNNYVTKALGFDRKFGVQSGTVFNQLATDFMKPVTDIVEELLNKTDIKVIVYNGQLDLIVDTPGTVKWVDKLKYPDSAEWKKAQRSTFSVNGIVEGYQKKAGNLEFYWVHRSGHMVPADNPAAMRFILQQATNNFSPKQSHVKRT